MNFTALMPPRIQALEKDHRGFPIPWNVLRGKENKPIFTANDDRKHILALKEDRCAICGQPNEKVRWFVGGPKSAFHPNGWYFDLPGHEECIEFALKVCPYLAAKNYANRIDIKDNKNLPDGQVLFVDYTQDPNRPTVFVMVGCTRVEVSIRPPAIYVRPADRTEVRYWRKGERVESVEGEILVAQALDQ
jgi:hypothetical protein